MYVCRGAFESEFELYADSVLFALISYSYTPQLAIALLSLCNDFEIAL
jgi:hypothetical protein